MEIKKLTTFLKDIFFPKKCIQCQHDGILWCEKCRADFILRTEQRCPDCEEQTPYGTACKQHNKSQLDAVLAINWYARPIVKKMIKAWKYHYMQDLEEYFHWMIRQWLEQTKQLPNKDWTIMPIPMTKRKERLRGFNQTKILAEFLQKETNYKISTALARKKDFLTPQAKLKEKQRAKRKFDSVFTIKSEAPKNIILVDDVYTTGATMKAAAKELKKAGAETVIGLVLARGN